MNIIMFIALSRSLQSKEVWFDDIIGILILVGPWGYFCKLFFNFFRTGNLMYDQITEIDILVFCLDILYFLNIIGEHYDV